MGCTPLRQRYLEKLKKISQNSIEERIVEQIMLSTLCKNHLTI
jgi:hypothetical protein